MAHKLSGVAKIANGAHHKRPAGRKHKAGAYGRKKHKSKLRKHNPSAYGMRLANGKRHAGKKHMAGKHKRRKRNPDMDFAGLPIVEALAGAGIAIAAHALINAIPVKAVKDMTGNATYGKYIAPAVIAGSGFALNHYTKNPMLKKIGTFTAFCGVFLAVNEAVGDGVKKGVDSLFKGKDDPPKIVAATADEIKAGIKVGTIRADGTQVGGAYGRLGGAYGRLGGAREALGGQYISPQSDGSVRAMVGGNINFRGVNGPGFLANIGGMH